MRNKNKQTKGYLTLTIILLVTLILAIVAVGKKLQQAHIKSIEQTIQEQFTK